MTGSHFVWKILVYGSLLPLLICGIAGCRAAGPAGDNSQAVPPERAEEGTQAEIPFYVTGQITGLRLLTVLRVEAGPKSVELMPGGNRIFVNDLYAHKNFIFDARTYARLLTVVLPDEPVEADFSPDGRWAWVSLYNSASVVLVDTESGALAGEVDTGSIPKEVAVSPDGAWVYVANWNSNTVTVIDARSRTRVKDIPLYATPRGMCFSPQGDKAYVCIMGGDTLAEVDVAGGHVVTRQIPCGQNPRHVVPSPDGKSLYVSNNVPGTVTVVDREAGTITATIKVGRAARTLDITPDGKYLFVCNYEDGTVGCVDLAARRQIFTYPTSKPIGLCVDSRGECLFVSNYAPPQVTVLEIVR
ncbi:MAG: beta-propeller fold lactonase family protein [Actinomycetota bacterium]|nr:beta-propeller fold lactonase family protein [Actinomycetota bacterium]